MQNIDKNYQHLTKIFLELITTNAEFKKRLQAFAPSIYADIESAATNPNCSCRARVEAHLNQDREKSAEFLNSFRREFNLEVNLVEIEQKYGFEPYSGRVEKVKISEWKEFVNQLNNNRAAYRTASVVRIDDEYVNVFFI